MQALKPTNLREQAKEALRAGIIAGELAPGRVYSATSLSTLLGVSATPVREAMLDLVNDGLVEAMRNRGYRILTVADSDLDEIFELRKILEVAAVKRVIESTSDSELEALEQLVAPIERAADRTDLFAFLRADRAFHLAILEMTGNHRLVRMVGQLRDQTRLMGLRRIADAGLLSTSALEHRSILEALRARDVDAAERLVRHHLDHTRGAWAGRSEGERLE
jgi:DNA-binding GntR family transcriptional regulator